MGYTRLLLIREEPIRRYLAEHGETVELAEEIGRAILATSNEDGYDAPICGEKAQPRPLYDEAAVFHPVRSFHSSAHGLLVWTGSTLVVVERNSIAGFEALELIARQIGDSHVLRAESYDFLLNRPDDYCETGQPVIASIWSVDQDHSRWCVNPQSKEYPSREVGAAVLWRLRRQELVSRGVGAEETQPKYVWKNFDITSQEFALFAWTPYLRRIGDLSETERRDLTSAMRSGLAWLRPAEFRSSYPIGVTTHQAT